MGWFSGLFGNSAQHQAEDAAEAAAKADAARKLAEAQAAETARQQAEYQQSLINMQRESLNLQANNKADLGTDASSNVVAGGTANDVSDATAKKKKLVDTSSMSAQLGINV